LLGGAVGCTRRNAASWRRWPDVETGLLLIVGGVATGVFGSLLGLGGGILIVPLLTLGFGLPLREAVGVSLVCVIVTSGASAAVYLERKVANLRLGMVLELFTAIGAVMGGAIAFLLDERLLAGLFAVMLAYVAATMLRGATKPAASSPPLELDTATADAGASAEPTIDGPTATGPTPGLATVAPDLAQVSPGPLPLSATERLSAEGYEIHRLGPGAAGSVVAGVLSALLGIGGGIIKVPVMHLVMGVPLRVATATSNLMIGITASTSAIVYLLRGGIDPYAAGPAAIGVFVGASIGSRTAHRIDVRVLRLLFVVVLLYTAFEMLRRAVGAA
jgi:uncharacterized membrane protein YfcA